MAGADSRFTVQVGEFEGPLTVLLNLIEERKLHVSQVSLAAVADSFVAYMNRLDSNHKDEVADFIVVAATLMLIKSAALLPTLELSVEEKTDMADLERRLKLYQEIKQALPGVDALFDERPIYFPLRQREFPPVFTPTPGLNLANLHQAIKGVLQALPLEDILPKVILKKIVSLEEVMASLGERVGRALSLSFREFVGDKRDKVDLIVSFLGVLELVKQGLIRAEQSMHFGDIALETTRPDLPRYL